MKNNKIIIVLRILFISITISCNNQDDNMELWERYPDLPHLDTSNNIIENENLKIDIINYMDFNRPFSIEKMMKYSIDSFYECIIKINPETAKKYSKKNLFSEMYNSISKTRVKTLSSMKKLKTNIQYEIQNVKSYKYKETLISIVKLNSFYIFKNEKREVNNEIICIKEKNNRNWKFIDKENALEILNCKFETFLTNQIMSK